MSCIPLERSINQFQNKTNHSKSKFVTKIKYFDFIGQLCKSWLLAIFPLLTCAVTNDKCFFIAKNHGRSAVWSGFPSHSS